MLELFLSENFKILHEWGGFLFLFQYTQLGCPIAKANSADDACKNCQLRMPSVD